MLKINNSKRIKRRGRTFILSSLLVASLSLSNVSDVQAKNTRDYEVSIKDGLETCELSDTTKGIVSAIVKTTENKRVLSDIDIALEDDELRECFLAQGICTFAQEQKKIKYKEAYEKSEYTPYLYINYDIDDICVIDNLNGLSSILPKQICLLTKLTDFGNYQLYGMHADSPTYVITNKDGKALSVSTGNTYDVFKTPGWNVTPFKDYLEYVGLEENDSYSHLELFEELTFKILESLNNYSENVKSSDVLVIDGTDSLTNSFNRMQDYYFIKYMYPYSFIDGRHVYKDVANPTASITVDNENTLLYYDKSTGTEILDLDYHYIDGGSSTSCLVKLRDFLKEQGMCTAFYLKDSDLVDLNNKYNKGGKELKNTYK